MHKNAIKSWTHIWAVQKLASCCDIFIESCGHILHYCRLSIILHIRNAVIYSSKIWCWVWNFGLQQLDEIFEGRTVQITMNRFKIGESVDISILFTTHLVVNSSQLEAVSLLWATKQPIFDCRNRTVNFQDAPKFSTGGKKKEGAGMNTKTYYARLMSFCSHTSVIIISESKFTIWLIVGRCSSRAFFQEINVKKKKIIPFLLYEYTELSG